MNKLEGTTICAVRKGGVVAIAGDGQATSGDTVVKGNSRKIRRIFDDKIITGFAGTVADAFVLFDLFESKLKEASGDLSKAIISLAREWRMDRNYRKLEAVILASDGDKLFYVSGAGDILEPEYDAIGIGSGGNYAQSAARAYLDYPNDLTAEQIARKAVSIAADICIYTNHNIISDHLEGRK
ncbi:MAG: ATP-dependent protease subunit HslV [Sphaerochaetaceae bacterium]|nr:ATP-dependent protease subunit HslV [Sphaerochaetaceae bacterium]